MIIMILGELCNFGAYAFVEAIIVVRLNFFHLVFAPIESAFCASDTHGRALRRHLVNTIPLFPQ